MGLEVQIAPKHHALKIGRKMEDMLIKKVQSAKRFRTNNYSTSVGFVHKAFLELLEKCIKTDITGEIYM